MVTTLLKFHARVDVFDNEGRSGLHLGSYIFCDEIKPSFININTE